MWQHPRLAWVLVGAALLCFMATAGVEGTDHNRRQAPRWRWPDETPSRVGAGRLIPVGRPAAAQLQLQPVAPQQSQLSDKFTPIENLPRTRPAVTEKPEAAIVASSLPPVPAREPVEAVKITSDADIDPPATTSVKNATAVPLLKDAGKPGNPYILLNDIFPPQNSIRTKEQEEANFNSLHNKDLGGLDPSEVYLADDDLFVVRGFDFKKPYSADPPGAPISDYQAPAPLPPPPPEPGTVFYPSNETDATFNFFNPDFNSKDPSDLPFFPLVPGGLNENNGQQPNFPDDPNFLPFPFLPPPPPHWTEEKEFDENDIRDPFQSGGPAGGNFPFAQGAPPPGQGFALFNGTQGPPPPSGLNGFPGIGGLPPFQGANPQAGPPPGGLQRPPGFPPGGPGGFPLGGQGGAPPPSTSGPNANVTLVDEDEDVPFTPLFPERPVEFYYPTHNTTAQEPGPYGPGIFVPPPLHFFAPRNKSEKINVDISPKLFLPPFNLPNYYQKVSASAARPLSPPRPPQRAPPPGHLPASQHDGFFGNNQQIQKVPAYKPNQPNPFANPTKTNEQKAPALPANVQYEPVKSVLLDTNYKEVGKLPQLPQHQPFGYSYQQGHPPFHTPLDPTAYGPGAQTPIKLSTSQPTQPNYNIPSQQHPQHPFYLPAKGTTGVSLESDIDVNFRPQRPAVNPDSELIDPALLNPNPTYTNPNPTQNWNPYTAVYAHQVQPPKYESLSQPTAQHPTVATSSREKPTNFVAVYRIGGGSYSYNLSGGR